MAIAGSLLGAWMGARLASDRLPRTRSLRYAAIGAAVAVGAMVLYGLHKPADEGVRGTISIAEAGAPPGEGVVTVALDPPDAAQDAEWFQAISWQGGGLVLDDMQPTGEPGTYRTSGSVPLDSDWKTLVRLQKGDSLTGLPVYLPAGRGDSRRRGPGDGRQPASSSPTTRSSSASSSPPPPACGPRATGSCC